MCIPALVPMFAAAGSFLSANAGVISLIGAGVGAVGAYQQSAAQKDAAKYASSVAAANAKVAEFKAQDAQDRAVRDAETLGRQYASLRGKQRAGLAQNGLDLASGTPAALQDATDYYSLQDQATVANNANKEAWSLRTQRDNYNTESQMQRNRAGSISPFGAAATSLLGSAPSIANRWAARQPTVGGVW